MCAGARSSVSSRFSVNFYDFSGRSRKRSFEARSMSFFLFWFWFVGESRQFSGAGSSLRSDAGLEETVDASCSGDVEDEFVPEFDDNPGPTRGTKFSVWPKNILPLALSTVVFDRWSSHR